MIAAALRARTASPPSTTPPPLERRRVPSDLAGLRSLFAWGGLSTAAGPLVNEYSALAHPTVYACVRILSQTIAALPLHLKRREGRRKVDATELPLFDVLHSVANETQTAYQLRQFLAASYLLRGNALAWKETDRAGRTVGLFPLRWDHIDPRVEGGRVVFHWHPDNGPPRTFARSEVLHITGLSTDGVVGLSPIAVEREAVGYGLAMQEHSSRFFSNGAQPSGVITHPERLGGGTEEEAAGTLERLRTQWEQLYGGVENSHKVAILEEGMRWEAMTLSAKDSEFLASRAFNRSDIASIFGVPSHLVGDDSKGEFSIETRSLEFVIYYLTPHLVNFEQQIARDLIAPEERATLYAKHNVAGLLRGDAKTRFEAHAQGIQNSFLTPNEVREKEDLDPIDGGDEVLVPLNMARASERDALERDAADPPPPVTPAPGDPGAEPADRDRPPPPREVRARLGARADLASSFRPTFEELGRVLVAAESREVRKLAKASLGETLAPAAIDGFVAGVEALYAPDSDLRELFRLRSTPIVTSLARAMSRAAADEIGVEPDLAKFEEVWISALAGAFVARYAIASQLSMNAAVRATPEAAGAAVDAVLEKWAEVRPERMARKETVQQARATSRETFRRAGFTRMRWRTVGDNCPFCEKMNGTVVGIQATFLTQGTTFEAEGRPPLTTGHDIPHPPLHRGCNCEIEAMP